MHRIDSDGIEIKNGKSYFSDGVPGQADSATTIDASWLNSVQETLCRFIEKSGIDLKKDDNDQLIDAFNSYLKGQEFACEIKTSNVSPAREQIVDFEYVDKETNTRKALNFETLGIDHAILDLAIKIKVDGHEEIRFYIWHISKVGGNYSWEREQTQSFKTAGSPSEIFPNNNSIVLTDQGQFRYGTSVYQPQSGEYEGKAIFKLREFFGIKGF